MELKQDIFSMFVPKLFYSNRTFMELKRIIKFVIILNDRLQSHLYGIETLRFGTPKRCDRLLQSHLYGIETIAFGLKYRPIVHSNRTFMELKQLTP